jgi:hypothetical protein
MMLDAVAKKSLSERLTNNPEDRERFIADTAQFLKDAGVSVLERPARSDSRTRNRVPGPPVPVQIGR